MKKKIINKAGLSQEILDKIAKELKERKKRIEKDITEISGQDKQVKFPNYGDKADDNAQEIGEYTTNLATDKVLEDSLRDIDNALDRIEKGTYGICKYCHKEIGEKRLLARPVASACIACKTKLQNS